MLPAQFIICFGQTPHPRAQGTPLLTAEQQLTEIHEVVPVYFPGVNFFKGFNIWRFFGMINLFPDLLDPANRSEGRFYVDIGGALFFQRFFHVKVTLL